jgi:hypothetical protein
MEYCKGGDLFSKIIDKKLDEEVKNNKNKNKKLNLIIIK